MTPAADPTRSLSLRGRFVGARWRLRERYLLPYVFVHIPKTGGTSIERALGIQVPEHETALRKRQQLGARRWERRFTFAVVRNPFDRAVSHYHGWADRNRTAADEPLFSFPEWVRAAYVDHDPRCVRDPRMLLTQREYVCDSQGEMLVEFVARFERLADDWELIRQRLGGAAALPHERKSTRSGYRDYYDHPSRETIESFFAADFDTFSYGY